MKEVNKRLIRGDEIIYPITDAGNVKHLQRKINEKLPIVSSSAPQPGTYVERQVWLKTENSQLNNDEEVEVGLPLRIEKQTLDALPQLEIEEETSSQLEPNDLENNQVQLEEN